MEAATAPVETSTISRARERPSPFSEMLPWTRSSAPTSAPAFAAVDSSTMPDIPSSISFMRAAMLPRSTRMKTVDWESFSLI